MSNDDFKIFTQLLNVAGTCRWVWVLKRVPSYPVRALGSYGPVAMAVFKGSRCPWCLVVLLGYEKVCRWVSHLGVHPI